MIRSRDLDRIEGVYHAFQNRADRHRYIGAFDEIAAQGALGDSGDELAKRLARICQLAQETDVKLTDWWFRHINPETRNGIAHEPAEAQPDRTVGSNVPSCAERFGVADTTDASSPIGLDPSGLT